MFIKKIISCFSVIALTGAILVLNACGRSGQAIPPKGAIYPIQYIVHGIGR